MPTILKFLEWLGIGGKGFANMKNRVKNTHACADRGGGTLTENSESLVKADTDGLGLIFKLSTN